MFVIFNENNSFDHEYGTFPGVNGLFSDGQNPRSAADTPGFYQTYTDVNGAIHKVQPFRVGPQQNATFVDSTDHSHTGLAAKLNVVRRRRRRWMASPRTNTTRKAGSAATAAPRQAKATEFANLVMSHVDCDTIPFFWQCANRFTIFDNIFATEDTPSTPNAIAMIAGQSGEIAMGGAPERGLHTTQTASLLPDDQRRDLQRRQARRRRRASRSSTTRSRGGVRPSTRQRPIGSRRAPRKTGRRPTPR